ncbi:hypothetical protein RA265_27610, partial [Pseudomonas syringae pv. tagetis]|uniref:hypothetical protein n=1 Tax=Pseudomonas syringae group genomosp. 7 TaxID=251699 RepID=UPI00376F556F
GWCVGVGCVWCGVGGWWWGGGVGLVWVWVWVGGFVVWGVCWGVCGCGGVCCGFCVVCVVVGGLGGWVLGWVGVLWLWGGGFFWFLGLGVCCVCFVCLWVCCGFVWCWWVLGVCGLLLRCILWGGWWWFLFFCGGLGLFVVGLGFFGGCGGVVFLCLCFVVV